jgi:PAS domain S-box-containing protein
VVAERRNESTTPVATPDFDQRNLAAVAEGLPELVALSDLEGRLFHLNAAAVAMTGIPADGGGKRLSDLHPRDRHAFLEAGIAGALGDGFWQGDNLLLGSDGEPRLASQVIVVPRDGSGRPACLATVIRDVSEQRAQQEQLRLSEHRLRQVIEHVADVLFEQDLDGRFTFLNPAWCEATGFTLEESLGRHFVEFVHPDDATPTREAFEALLNDGTAPAIQPMRYLTRDGQFRWMEARARRLTDANDMPAGSIGTLRDVTAQRAMAEEIARAHQQALQSSAMMSEFLANMSHEIRTPLNGVVGLTTILGESDLNADQRQLVLGAQKSAEMLLTLVNDILDLSKIEAGSLLLDQTAFDIRGWVNEMAEPGFAKARKKGLDVRLDVSAELPPRIVGDATRIGQILSNLIDNAVKFTSAGVVSVVAVPSQSPDGKRMLRVSVADSGIGIPLDKQALVFEKYRQADGSYHPPLRRYRAGPGHLPPAGDPHGRRRRARKHRGRRLHVLVRDSAGGRAARRAAAGAAGRHARSRAAGHAPRAARRGQPHQPVRGAALHREGRLHRRGGEQRRRGARKNRRGRFRRRVHGLPDADHGRLRGHQAHPPGAAVQGADRRHDGARHEGRSRAVPRRGNDRVPVEAAQARHGGGDDRPGLAAARCLIARPSGGR